jgi:lactate dehydrogenase-like 2-hydroxyacid dehydrogenase
LESVGNVEWAPEKTQDKLGVKVQEAAIASEYNRVTARVTDAGKGALKGIVAYSVGYDHIDVTAATERGIYVAEVARMTAEETVLIVRGEVPTNLVNRSQLAAKGVRV